ncbi:DNA polymerase III, chi subunit [Modicisalibacter muralis]|uniref:DNA polymerase III, chi subunit n=1 Tax=Modicisalibacter muralis TaxID=119000 RepID=A0A1G9IJB8_9GAMM|nr:DNA polymerase III subunit chi [Halomonas muralis]SDL25222.1 DNA polymerase III, chi subunit [Halomonas muralis]
MTQIDFYILPDTTIEARLDFACRLVETIYRKGHGLHVHAENEQQAREFDERLWTFRPDSYVPHALIDASETPTPVTIGWDEPPTPQAPGSQAMLNLHPEIPEWFSRFERVAEIINQHQDVLASKRDCWQTYKRRGYPVRAHHLG